MNVGQLGALLGKKVGRRLRQVGAGFAEGARQAKAAYAESLAEEPRRRAAAARPPLDPRIAGYYANLEIEPGADLEQVTRAWKKLVREFHPDRYAADPARQAAATRLVQDLNHAHRELAAHLGRPGAGPQPAARKPRK